MFQVIVKPLAAGVFSGSLFLVVVDDAVVVVAGLSVSFGFSVSSGFDAVVSADSCYDVSEELSDMVEDVPPSEDTVVPDEVILDSDVTDEPSSDEQPASITAARSKAAARLIIDFIILSFISKNSPQK